MAIMIDPVPSNIGEKLVYQKFKNNLSDTIIVYHNRELSGKEYDFCLVIPNQGLLIVEVKGWRPAAVKVLNSDEIHVEDLGKQNSPKKQANRYRYEMIDRLKKMWGDSPKVISMVAFPRFTEREFYETRMDIVVERESVLLKKDLENSKVLPGRIYKAFGLNKQETFPMNNYLVEQFRSWYEPDFVSKNNSSSLDKNTSYSCLGVLPEPITEEKALKLLHLYEKGSKLILFFGDLISYENMLLLIEDWFKRKDLIPKRNSLEFSYAPDNIQTGKQGFQTFNMEIHFLENLKNLFPEETFVFNGQWTSEQKERLMNIARITSFNIEQFEVEHASAEKNIIVRAGAGTGKTFTMVSRIGFLTFGKKPYISDLESQLVMVTFTNQAASVMKKRLSDLYMNYFRVTGDLEYLKKIQAVYRAQISTISSFALELIRQNASTLGYGQNLSVSADLNLRNQIYDHYFDQYLQKKERDKEQFGINLKMFEIIKLLKQTASKFFQKNIDLEKISLNAFEPVQSTQEELFNQLLFEVMVPAEEEYEKELKKKNMVALDHLIIELTRLLNQSGESILKNVRFMFVDEFQDTDNVQIDLFSALYKNSLKAFKFFLVGDLKQSIYRFRGASSSAFDRMQKQTRFWEEFLLIVNYRSDPDLLCGLAPVFGWMGNENLLPYQNDKDCLQAPENKTGYIFNKEPSIQKIALSDNKDKKEALTNILIKQKEMLEARADFNSLSREDKTIAILVRTNKEIEDVMKWSRNERLAEKGILIEPSTDLNLFKQPAVIDLTRLLGALNNPCDPVYLAVLLSSNYGNPKLNYAGISGLNKAEKMKRLQTALNEHFKANTGYSWDQLCEAARNEPLLGLISEIYTKLAPWKRYSIDNDQQKQYSYVFEQLIQNIQGSQRLSTLTLHEVFSYLNTNIKTDQYAEAKRRQKSEIGKVTIICTTIHKSKGLEFGTVILPETDKKLNRSAKSSLEIEKENNHIGYYVKKESGKSGMEIQSNYFDYTKYINEGRQEESRILYVALTRAIHTVIWMTVPSVNSAELTWADCLGVESYDQNSYLSRSL